MGVTCERDKSVQRRERDRISTSASSSSTQACSQVEMDEAKKEERLIRWLWVEMDREMRVEKRPEKMM